MTVKQYDLTVSIVTYCNDYSELLETVNSVLYSEGVSIKLYIIDNSPTDELRKLFTDDYRIEYRFMNANLGFGKAHNIAMRAVLKADEAPYHLVLNPDISFDRTQLRKMLDYLNCHPQVGHMLPKVLTADTKLCLNRQRRLLPTPLVTLCRVVGPLAKVLKKTMFEYYTRFESYDMEMSSPCLSGCFMLLRVDAIRKVGLFDERFFMYFEDIDLSRRYYAAYGNMYWPEAKVYHVAHTDSHHNLRLMIVHLQSMIKYYNKWGWIERNRSGINDRVVKSRYNKY